MSGDDIAKVTPARLRRDAYLYIRQSTLYQVINNTESTGRQYDLKSRAVALGWPEDKIHVIDIDQGRSGASGVRAPELLARWARTRRQAMTPLPVSTPSPSGNALARACRAA